MSVSNVYHKAINWIRSDIDRALLTALVFTLPFDRIPSIDVFGITIRFSLIFGSLIILRFCYLLFNKKIKFKLQLQEKLLLFFLIWIVLIIPESINLKRAVEVVAFNTFTVVTALSVAHLFKKKYIRPIIFALLISATGVVIFGFYQYVGDILGLPMSLTGLRDRYTWSVFGFPRIQATALEPLYLAAYLLLPLSVALSAYLSATQSLFKKSNRLLLLVFIFSLGIFMTVSRGGIYGMVVMIFAVVIFMLWKGLTNFKRAALSLAILVLAFIMSLLVINFINKPPSEFTKGSKGAGAYVAQIQDTGTDEGGDERAKSRQRALLVINENKSAIVLGIGPGQFGPYVQNNIKVDGHWTIVNNLTLELLVETGLIGLVLIVFFFAITIWKGLRVAITSKDRNITILVISMSGFLISQAIQYQTYSTLYVMHIWAATGLLLGLIATSSAKK